MENTYWVSVDYLFCSDIEAVSQTLYFYIMLFKIAFAFYFVLRCTYCGKNVDVRGQFVEVGSFFLPHGMKLGHQAGKAVPLPTELSC